MVGVFINWLEDDNIGKFISTVLKLSNRRFIISGLVTNGGLRFIIPGGDEYCGNLPKQL